MKDKEFMELRNRFLLGVFIALVVVIPLFFVLIYRFDTKEPIIEEDIILKETFFLFIESNNCTNCNKLENIMKNENIDYEKISIESENYEEIKSKLNISNLNISPPSILYIYNNEVVDSLNIKNENELKEFLRHMEERW